jgi:hypothetical protein
MKRWIPVLAALALAACGDSPSGPDGGDGNVTAVPTHAGAPTGAAVTVTIGPEGGVLESGDGKLGVVVPAGAVASATTFSVQPIASKAWGALASAGAWRLEPHGTTFAKPVRLTIRYDDADLDGTVPALLRLASQDAEGYWRLYRQTAVDEAQRTISVETTHFSDWSAIAGARVFAEVTTLETGATTPVRVRDCRVAGAQGDDLLAPLLYECRDGGIYAGSARNWSVNGVVGGHTATTGRVTKRDAEPGVADFRAPDALPEVNPVAVSVEYAGTDPKDRGLLVTHIDIVEAGNACAALRDVERWTATFGASYVFGGTNPDGEQLALDHSGELASTLVKLSEGPGGVSWLGTVTGSVAVNDRETWPVPNSEPFVTTLIGGGAPANSAEVPEERAHVWLNVNLDECTWNAGMTMHVRATETQDDGTPYTSDRFVGSVRLDERPITSLTAGGFTGQLDVLAHSEGWGLDNDGDGYFPGGLGEALYGRHYRAEGQAGTARVEWSFAPAGR